MAAFIGLHMLVSLRDQPARFQGTVSGVEAGASPRLTLNNGLSHSSYTLLHIHMLEG